MKCNDSEQTDPALRRLLRESWPEPPLPPRFQEAVWRRIGTTDSPAAPEGASSWIDRLVGLVLRPRAALAGMMALIVVGGAAGAFRGSGIARQVAQDRYVAAVAPSVLR